MGKGGGERRLGVAVRRMGKENVGVRESGGGLRGREGIEGERVRARGERGRERGREDRNGGQLFIFIISKLHRFRS